jgi:hypothetical protein
MARAIIHLSDANYLPPLCVTCGRPARASRAEKFTWHPSWIIVCLLIGLVPLLIAYLLTRRTATLTLPFCPRHAVRSHRVAYIVLSGFGLAAAVGAVWLFQTDLQGGLDEALFMMTVGVLLVTGFIAVVASDFRVKAKDMDDRSVTLEGVSAEFARAVGQGWERPSIVPSGGIELITAKYLRS